MKNFYDGYFQDFSTALESCINELENKENLEVFVEILKDTLISGSTIYLIGNGGSAAIAEHMAVDMTKNAKLRAVSFSSAAAITCVSNDLGYENVFKKMISSFLKNKDVLIAISSGGESSNIINAIVEARKIGASVITLTGFDKANSIRKLGNINLWVNSEAYGYVEIIHNLLLHYVSDKIIGSAKYKIND
jgi:D-sedoheptulose 7-phosphate isomerase